MKEQKQYTFEDWLNNKFWNEKDYLGNSVYNDSENYLTLVMMNKMTYKVLNKIQGEQNKAYEYMIKKSLETSEIFFHKDTVNSLDLQKVIDIKIEKIEKHITDNPELHYDIIRQRLHRGIKIGAKFIVPEQYNAYTENKLLDAFIISLTAPYKINIDNNFLSFPTHEQMKYAQMEVHVLWLKKLKEYKSSLDMSRKHNYDYNENFIFFYSLPIGNIIPSQDVLHDEQKQRNIRKHLHYMNCHAFTNGFKVLSPDKIKSELEFHLRDYVRKGGNITEWINETKTHIHYELTPKQKDAFLTALEDMQPVKDESKQQLKLIFDNKKRGYAVCLELFKELEIIDNNGKVRSQVKANEILGLAVALKESSHNLLRTDKLYSDENLMQIIQQHLSIPYTPNIKRRGKGYDNKRSEALALINTYEKKARVS